MELSRIKEADGDIASAATILQELQVTNVAVSAYALIQCTLCLCCYELFIWCHVLLYIYVYICAIGGDIWLNGEGGEGSVHSGADEAGVGQEGLHPHTDYQQED